MAKSEKLTLPMTGNTGKSEAVTQNVMPEKVYLHVGFSGGMATGGTWKATNEFGDKAEYVSASSLTSLRSENEKMRELLKMVLFRARMIHGGQHMAVFMQEELDRISHFTQEQK